MVSYWLAWTRQEKDELLQGRCEMLWQRPHLPVLSGLETSGPSWLLSS
jgi:hypothetical protein